MSTTLDLATDDAKDIIESEGTPVTIINDDGEYTVKGIVGDIGSLLDPVTGEPVQGRSIEATVIAETTAAGKFPARGWKVKLTGRDGKELILYVKRNEHDRTIGLCRLTLGINLEDDDDGE